MRAALAAAALAVMLVPATARATDVELVSDELVLELGAPYRAELTFAHAFDGTLFTLGLDLALDAEGGALEVGVRPVLAREADYRLVWASWVGPEVLGRDGASGGLVVGTELQNVVSVGPVVLMAAPKAEFAGAWGAQDGWRTRIVLVLGVGVVVDWLSVWLTGEAGYTLGGDGPGTFRLAAALTLGVRFGGIR